MKNFFEYTITLEDSDSKLQARHILTKDASNSDFSTANATFVQRTLSKSKAFPTDYWEIVNIEVPGNLQKSGIGTGLFKKFVNDYRVNKIIITLDVSKRENYSEFFKSLGFKNISKGFDDFSTEEVLTVLMYPVEAAEKFLRLSERLGETSIFNDNCYKDISHRKVSAMRWVYSVEPTEKCTVGSSHIPAYEYKLENDFYVLCIDTEFLITSGINEDNYNYYAGLVRNNEHIALLQESDLQNYLNGSRKVKSGYIARSEFDGW